MAITDYIPNVFGSAAPTTYEGLLGMGLITPEQLAQTKSTANIQGLLGAGLSLAQGMSRIGPRRSAAENILGALAGGFGAAGGAYQQGLQNIVQQQQLQSAALTQQQAANRLKAIQQAKVTYPDLAPLADIDPGKFAEEVALRERVKGVSTTAEPNTPEGLQALAQKYYSAGPNFKALGDAYMEQAKQLRFQKLSNITGKESPSDLRNLANTAAAYGNKPLADQLNELASRKELEGPTAVPTAEVAAPEQVVPTDGTKVSPATTVVANRGRVGQIQLRIDNINSEIARLTNIRTKDARETIDNLVKVRDGLQKDVDRFSIMEYDFTPIKTGLPKKYQSEVSDIEKLAQTGTLDAAGLRSSIEKFYTRLQEDERGRKLEGNAATFAQMKFGVTDRTQLTGPQLAEILRFENAPTAQQIAQLEQENIKIQQKNIELQFMTGRSGGKGAPIPTGKEFLLTTPVTTPAAPAVEVPPTIAPVVAPEAVSITAPAPRVAPEAVSITAPAPRVVPETVPRVAPENAPAQTRGLYQYNKNALINQPDSKFPPKQKVELRAQKTGSASAVNYGLTSIIDARDAALALRNNPVYIEALTGRTSPLRTQTIGGVVLDRDAYTAGQLLQNILTRNFVTEIQQMRQASPTGGAVGSVTEKEMEALSKIAAALSVGMSKDALERELDNYLRVADRSISTIPTAYAKTYGYAGEFDDLLTRVTVIPTPVTPSSRGQRPGSNIPPDIRKKYGLE